VMGKVVQETKCVRCAKRSTISEKCFLEYVHRSMCGLSNSLQMIEKNKDAQNQSLAELQQELKSLKSLLLSRPPTMSATPTSTLPMLGRPSIPAWQLATPASSDATSGASSAASTVMPSVPVANGKGKEPERTSADSS